MDGSLVLDTAPTVEPLTVAEAIRQLRIGDPAGEPTASAPTVALISPAAAGNVDNGAHRYRVTFVTSAGQTDAGDISEAITVADKTVNGKVTVSNIPIGGPSVTSRTLYRTAAGDSTYLLLATISDNTTTSYTDNIADASLGAGAPSSNTTDDPYITSLIKSARERVETETGRKMCTQQWDHFLPCFPSGCRPIEVPFPPIQTIDSIQYYDTNGTLQTLSSATYIVDKTDAYCYITLATDASWPTTQDRAQAVKINFTTGYGAASAVPEGLKSAIRLALLDIYVSPNPAGAQVTSFPSEVYERIIAPYRVPRIG